MTAQIAIHGRLGRDPRPIETGSGKPMTVASVAVTLDAREGGETGEATLWLDVLAFGRVADDLARHAKGDTVSVAGRLQISRFTSSTTGEARANWQCVADSVISARTVRPGGGRRSGSGDARTGARRALVAVVAPWAVVEARALATAPSTASVRYGRRADPMARATRTHRRARTRICRSTMTCRSEPGRDDCANRGCRGADEP